MDSARGKGCLLYEEYVTVAQNAAAGHDLNEVNFRMRRHPTRAVRRAEMHRTRRNERYETEELWDYSDEESEDYIKVNDEDDEIEIQANYMRMDRKSFLDKEDWQKLSQDDRNLWKKMSREGRNVILGNRPEEQQQKKSEKLALK